MYVMREVSDERRMCFSFSIGAQPSHLSLRKLSRRRERLAARLFPAQFSGQMRPKLPIPHGAHRPVLGTEAGPLHQGAYLIDKAGRNHRVEPPFDAGRERNAILGHDCERQDIDSFAAGSGLAFLQVRHRSTGQRMDFQGALNPLPVPRFDSRRRNGIDIG
jgi:hypothetical protein